MSSGKKWLLAGPVLALLITVGPSLMPQAGQAQSPVDPVSPVVTPLKLFVTLAGVLALAAAVIVLWRRSVGARTGTGSSSRTLAVRETLRLSARNRLHLISAGSRLLLVAEGEKGISVLHLPPLAGSAVERTRNADAEAEVEAERTSAERNLAAARVSAAARSAEDDGAVPRDMVLTPVPRLRREVPEGADFRKLLEQVR